MKKEPCLFVTLTLISVYWLTSSNPSHAQFGGIQAEQEKIRFLKTSHEETEAYLAELLKKEVSYPDYHQAHLEAEAGIHKALSRKIDIGFDHLPLVDVVEFFRENLDINIHLDRKVLEEASIDVNEAVTAQATGITARSALDFVLRNLSEPLTWTVQHEMLLITTLLEGEMLLQTKCYDVTDLVVTQGDKNEVYVNFEQLHQTIKSGCDENALWFEDDDEGGTISSVDALGIHCLVVRHTREIHDQIEAILAGLRRLRQKTPVVFKNVKRFHF